MEDNVLANQATTLFSTYYLVQIMTYRPFASLVSASSGDAATSAKLSELSLYSMTQCINAARSCASIMEAQIRRGYFYVPGLISTAQICAAVLVTHIWDLKARQKAGNVEDVKPPLGVTVESLMSDVQFFLRVLESAAVRWENAEQAL